MHTVKVVIASTAFSLWAFSAGAVTVNPADAMGQVGHTARVCGIVASAVYKAESSAHPTFVTLISPDQPNVNQALRARPEIIESTFDRVNIEFTTVFSYHIWWS